jgi:hypothetical protein
VQRANAVDKSEVVGDVEALLAWRGKLWQIHRPGLPRDVQFELPWLAEQENQNLSLLARELRNACGCASGGLLTSITFVACAASHFRSGKGVRDIGLAEAGSLLTSMVTAALVGKLLGLLWARWRLWRLATHARNRTV